MDSIWFILGIIGIMALSLVFEHYYLKTKAWTYRILEKKDSKGRLFWYPQYNDNHLSYSYVTKGMLGCLYEARELYSRDYLIDYMMDSGEVIYFESLEEAKEFLQEFKKINKEYDEDTRNKNFPSYCRKIIRKIKF